jgi:hypothetical protein
MLNQRLEVTPACPVAIHETIRLMAEIDKAIPKWLIE